jgi:hypothetical protein
VAADPDDREGFVTALFGKRVQLIDLTTSDSSMPGPPVKWMCGLLN